MKTFGLWFLGEVDLQFLCQKHNVTGCPKRRHKQRDNDTLTPTILMMQFVSAGKYLCMNRNATFYAVVSSMFLSLLTNMLTLWEHRYRLFPVYS